MAISKQHAAALFAIALTVSCNHSKVNESQDNQCRSEKPSIHLTERAEIIDSIFEDFISSNSGLEFAAFYEKDTILKRKAIKLNIKSWSINGFIDTVIQSEKSDRENKAIALRRFCKLKSADFQNYNECMLSSEATPNYDTTITEQDFTVKLKTIDTTIKLSKEILYYSIEHDAIGIKPLYIKGIGLIVTKNNKTSRNVWKRNEKGKWAEIARDSLIAQKKHQDEEFASYKNIRLYNKFFPL